MNFHDGITILQSIAPISDRIKGPRNLGFDCYVNYILHQSRFQIFIFYKSHRVGDFSKSSTQSNENQVCFSRT